jgi:hypothetical protein
MLRQLKLPIDERGRRRAAAGRNGSPKVDRPLETHGLTA